jgi:hypothetical protein
VTRRLDRKKVEDVARDHIRNAGSPAMSARLVPRYLTKTRYLNGLACHKWLWLEINAPDRLPKIDESTEHLLIEGRRIGELARRRYPQGVLLPTESVRQNDERSKRLLDKRLPLFEAGFVHPGGTCYARADVLLPVGKRDWKIVEVKSGTRVKEEYLHDLAFQEYCYAGAGLKIQGCSLLLVDTEYIRSGDIDPLELLREEDVTDAVRDVRPTVQPNVQELLKVADAKRCPEFGRGEPFHEDEAGVHEDDSIWQQHPDSDIRELYRGGKQALVFLESGVYRISDIPKSVVLRGKQVIQHDAHTRDNVHLDRKKIAGFLKTLRYPLHFLDFETVYPAIPLFDGTRPYQQIPFQFSVHVVEGPGQEPLHHSFLSLEPSDPRKRLLESLRQVIRPEGHLVAYNQSFEMSRLEDLATLFPEHAEWVSHANARFVDLMTPFREFAYYNPSQRGSASLKAVLPAITGRGYDELTIANGSQASQVYLNAAFGIRDGKEASDQPVEEIRTALERYCGQDTAGMVWIVEALTELASERGS